MSEDKAINEAFEDYEEEVDEVIEDKALEAIFNQSGDVS